MTAAQILNQAVSERDWQATVVTYAKFSGWWVMHQLDSRGTEPGWPDLVLLREGEVLFVELKSENGKVSQAQETVQALLRSAGCEVHVWRPSQWPEVEVRLARKVSR